MRHTVGVLHCYANQIHAIGDAIRHPDPNVRRSASLDGIGSSRDLKRRTRRCAGQRKNPDQDRNRHRDASDSEDTLLQLDSVLQTASLSLIRRYGTSMIFFQKQPSLLPSAVTKSAAKTVSLSESTLGTSLSPGTGQITRIPAVNSRQHNQSCQRLRPPSRLNQTIRGANRVDKR